VQAKAAIASASATSTDDLRGVAAAAHAGPWKPVGRRAPFFQPLINSGGESRRARSRDGVQFRRCQATQIQTSDGTRGWHATSKTSPVTLSESVSAAPSPGLWPTSPRTGRGGCGQHQALGRPLPARGEEIGSSPLTRPAADLSPVGRGEENRVFLHSVAGAAVETWEGGWKREQPAQLRGEGADLERVLEDDAERLRPQSKSRKSRPAPHRVLWFPPTPLRIRSRWEGPGQHCLSTLQHRTLLTRPGSVQGSCSPGGQLSSCLLSEIYRNQDCRRKTASSSIYNDSPPTRTAKSKMPVVTRDPVVPGDATGTIVGATLSPSRRPTNR
jgi:hypothetical protein